MSRSFKHSPIVSTIHCESEKKEKQLWHQKWRAKNNASLNHAVHTGDAEALESFTGTDEREVSHGDALGKGGRKFLGFGALAKIAFRALDVRQSSRNMKHILAK